MVASRSCQECGAALPENAPEGLCPKCLMLVAMGESRVGVTLNNPAKIDGPGTTIGRYELLELIGEGGMGLVYLAEQKEPVRRKVALKIIKPGMDSRQIVARFEAERQALALLDHPNIAHVFDAGCTETGRPYFVMEHVRGMPITRYCDENKLTIEQRLRLFEQVCEAVHHAHQKGIIHRDLKPSNVLVSVQGDRPIPKIIDFGIAKAITAPLTDKTAVTLQGQLLGTPDYMSPEQVDLAMQDIDTRSDIYSLGVVLYELLAGVLPFEEESFARAGLAEIQQTIREQEPASPSLRLTSLGEKAKTIAASRGTQVLPLARRLHRELEWIPLKAMRKDRCRRYRSASEMADDLRNYLNGLPLLAGPETTIYRVQKFVRKHAGSVAMVALVAVAILLGLVVSTAMYFRAESMRVQAEQAREAEQEQRELAQCRAEDLRRSLYVNSIQLADAKCREGNASRVRDLLVSCPNDLRGWEWNRLNYIQDESISTLPVHQEGIRHAVFSPDGKRIATGGHDSVVKVCDAQSGAEITTLRGHQGFVNSVTFSPDGHRIASGSYDKTIRLWDAQTGIELTTLRGHQGGVNSVVFSPDGRRVISGSADRTIKLWDAQSGAEINTLRGHRRPVMSVALSADGRRIVSGARDNTLKIWDADSGAELLTVRLGDKGFVWCAAFSPDGRRIASGSTDGTMKVWDAETGKLLITTAGDGQLVTSVTYSQDGTIIASGHYDNFVRIWNAETGEELRTFRGHDRSVRSVSFSPDGQRLMSASADDTVKLWDVETSRESTKIGARAAFAVSIAFSPDGKRIASYGSASHNLGGTIKLWDAQTCEAIRTIPRTHWTRSVAFSPDGNRLVAGSGTARVARVWDASTGAELLTLRGHKGPVWCAAFSPDGRHIVSGGRDKTIKLWDAADGSEIRTLQGHVEGVRSVAFSPNGKLIISRGDDRTMRLWDLASGSEVRTFQAPELISSPAAFSPDGRRVLCAVEREIRIWDAGTGADLMTIRAHTDVVYSVAFSPDGKRIVSGSRDGTAKLWDSATGSELVTLRADSPLVRVAFSPDGTAIAGGTFDGDVVLWESAVPAARYEQRKNVESASEFVEKMHRECGSYHDVIRRLAGDMSLAPAVRKVALQIAGTCAWEDADHLMNEAWATIWLPDKDAAAYRAALEKVDKANVLEPNDRSVLNTLGAAQYRMGFHEDALRTLAKAERVLSDTGDEPNPWNLAFEAMALHKLGRVEEAKATLARLREMCKDEEFTYDVELLGLLAEAGGLIESKRP